ncbi:MAG: hypothetical protein ACK587_00445 [Cyanobacteriota bacterium]|jgi:hypothetical protein
MASSPSASTDPSEIIATEAPAPATGPHDFEAQKRIHQQIRNDPDYDDWEYGTEPLPHEAWVPGQTASPQPGADDPAPGG